MRKIIYIITALVLSAAFFTACTGDTEKDGSAFEAQYIRTDGYIDGREYPIATLITSEDELAGYIEQYDDDYYLNEPRGESGSFIDAVAKYDGDYFADNVIVLALLEEGSGSIRHEVVSVGVEDEAINVEIKRIVPEMGTDDMAEWHIIIEMPKDGITSQEVKINMTE
jgi:hypothetical protein